MTEDIAPVQKTTTALAVRGQLAEAQEQLAKAKKQYGDGAAGAGLGLGGVGALLAGAVALFVCAPVGFVLLAGGLGSFGIGLYINGKAEKNAESARATVAALEASAKPAALISDPTFTHGASPDDETLARQKALTFGAWQE
jgi:hypothetical protein